MLDDTFAHYQELIRSPFGMVICAGPTGSGKTTTLYATLSAINDDGINIVTIEDPVEYLFPSINQIQTNDQAGVTFANGLRSILRQDPDAILVGEIRDVETARIAVQAALTGHFVMSSLHATDAPAALQRFMDMGLEAFLIASSLLGVVGQRLIRRVCPHCIEPYTLTPDEAAFYESSGGDPTKPTFIHGAGCNFCGNTGYFERIGVFEVLRVTDAIRRAIVDKASHEELREIAAAQGMKTLARPGHPARDRRQDNRCRDPPHGLRALRTRDPHAPLPIPRNRCDRNRRQGDGRLAQREPSSATRCCCRTSMSRTSRNSAGSATSSSASSACPRWRSCSSPGRWRRSCGPASRSPRVST